LGNPVRAGAAAATPPTTSPGTTAAEAKQAQSAQADSVTSLCGYTTLPASTQSMHNMNNWKALALPGPACGHFISARTFDNDVSKTCTYNRDETNNKTQGAKNIA
jgi:hypothetical protein